MGDWATKAMASMGRSGCPVYHPWTTTSTIPPPHLCLQLQPCQFYGRTKEQKVRYPCEKGVLEITICTGVKFFSILQYRMPLELVTTTDTQPWVRNLRSIQRQYDAWLILIQFINIQDAIFSICSKHIMYKKSIYPHMLLSLMCVYHVVPQFFIKWISS